MRRCATFGLLAVLGAIPSFAQEEQAAEGGAQGGPVDIRQVQIQVWISETNESGLRRLGANLDYTRFVRQVEQSGSVQQIRTSVFNPQEDFGPVTLPTPTAPDPNSFDPTLREMDGRDEDSGQPGTQTRVGFGLEASIIDSDQGSINAVFRGLERQNDVDLISKPELLVVNNGDASIKAGGNVPFQGLTFDNKGNPQLEVTWRDVGVNMDMQPTILSNDFIRMTIKQLDVTDVDRIETIRGVDLPVFAKRSQTGVVIVPDGQTLVIGGLSSRVIRKTERRVPLVGQIPVLGLPFRSRENEADITHLLIFVSPTIVDLRNLSERAFSALHFWKERGAEWRNEERIEREIETFKAE